MNVWTFPLLEFVYNIKPDEPHCHVLTHRIELPLAFFTPEVVSQDTIAPKSLPAWSWWNDDVDRDES